MGAHSEWAIYEMDVVTWLLMSVEDGECGLSAADLLYRHARGGCQRNATWGVLQNHCWGAKWNVRGERGVVGGCRWSLGHNVGVGVDEGALAALSVQVVAKKQQDGRRWDTGGDHC